METSIPRRKFIVMGSFAAASAFFLRNVKTVRAAAIPEGGALDFIRRYSDNFFVRREDARSIQITAEVQDFARLGAAFQSTRRHGIDRLLVSGTSATFKIGRRTFEVESLCPAEFAAQKS